MMLLLASCSHKSSDDILLTVPADTNYFVLADMKALSSDLGKEGRGQLDATLAKLSQKGDASDSLWQYFFSEDSGVDFSSPMVVFEFRRNMLASFFLKDADSFRQGIGKSLGTPLTESPEGIFYNSDATVFIKGDQAWFANPYPELSADDIATLAGMTEAESILSVAAAKEAASRAADVTSFCNLGKLLEGSWNSKARLLLNTVFDDASYIVSAHNFRNGQAIGETVFMNYKGKPAGLAFKMSEIKTGNLKKFDGKGNCFIALGMNPDLMHSIVRAVKNFGIIPAEMQDILESLDGDIAISLTKDTQGGNPSGISAMFTFKNKSAASDASSFLKQMGNAQRADIRTDGERLYITEGNPSGNDIESVAESFKGACLGVALLPSFFNSVSGASAGDYLDGCTVTLHDDGKGVIIKSILTTKGDRNALLTLLQLIEDF